MLAALVPLLAIAGSAVRAAPMQQSRNLGSRDLSSVIYNCNHDFAYTWDDGPYIYHDEILDDFDAVGAKTTFFVNGNNWSCIYDADNVAALRRTFEEGHQIASHTWSHASLTSISYAQIDVEIQRLDQAFVNILGVKPRFLRPPYGDINDDVATYIQNTYGKRIVMWSDDSTDSTGGSVQDSYNFYAGMAAQGPGHPHICLSHETEPSGIGALREGTVNLLHNAGINMVTVAQCVDDQNPYEYVGGYGTPDSTWYCDGTWTPPSNGGGGNGGSCVSTYTSVSGDTCASIGSKFGLTAAQILAANTFLNCQDIWINTPICIPPGGSGPTSTTTTTTTRTSTRTSSTTSAAPSCVQTYTSAAGDTCASIGSKFGLTANQILAANTFLNCQDIWTFTPICIPPGGSGPTSTTTTTTTSTRTSSTTSSTSAPSCVSTYTAGVGETCASIGAKYGLTANQILAANTFLNCNDIWQYTPICIPPGGSGPTSTTTTTTTRTSTRTSSTTSAAPSCVTTYISVAGDTCSTIGTKFGLTANQILAANTFLNCNDIWTYTPICVPPGGSGGSGPTSTTTTTTTSTRTSSTTSSTSSPSCVSTYTAGVGETCASIGAKYGLTANQILAANTFLNCNDIWQYTPICIPPGGTPPATCTQTYRSVAGDTCDSIGAKYGVSGAQILAWNSFLTCSDIWVNTPVCV